MSQNSTAKSKGTVLLVDDEPLLLDSLQALLSLSGYTAICASNGREALEILSKSHVDLILSDVRMPEMNGVNFLKVLRERKSGEKLIFVSAFADISIEEARELGASDVVTKPVRIESLVQKIEACLD